MPFNATATGILQSLGWAILHSFWQMALLWLAYFVFFGWHRRFSPTLKHNAAVAFLTIGTIWFLATFSNEYTKYLQVGRYMMAIPDAGGSTTNQLSLGGTLAGWNQFLQHFAERHIAWLSAAYLLITTLTAWKLLFSLWVVQQLKIKGIQPADSHINQLTDVLANQLHIHPKVRTFISDRVDVPATFGYLKPVILLPAAAITQLSPAQLESVIIHELAHIRRADYLVNILVCIMETILVHNPFAWLLVRSIRTERELCCDDIVLARKQDILCYAGALLALEKNRFMTQHSMALASNGHKGQLLARVQRMIEPGMINTNGSHRLIGIIFMGLLFVLLAWAIPGTTVAETRKEAQVEKQIRKTVRKTADVEIPFAANNGNTRTEKRRQVPAKLTDKERVWEQNEEDLNPMEELSWIEQMPAFPAPAPISEQAFSFNFQEQQAPSLFQQEVLAEKELQKLLGRKEIVRTTKPASGEQRMVWINNNVEQLAALRPEILHKAVDQEWKEFEQGVQQLQQEYNLSQQRLIENYRAPMVIYQNQARKAAALASNQRIRVIPQGTEPRIKKIKTAQGFVLRIETGAESIDIRISEDDLIVESKDGQHEND